MGKSSTRWMNGACVAARVMALTLALSACGGGGSGGGDDTAGGGNPPPPPPPAAIAPTVSVQPASVSVVAGQPASFTVVVAGTAPLQYQWLRNGAEVAGATAASYTIAAAAQADNGAGFAVRVSNSVGSVTSVVATLTVSAAAVAPTITAQPQSVSVTVGQAATFSVTAAGTGTLTYQWLRGGAPIVAANAASYTIPATALADNGARFSVRVGNAQGAVNSTEATLTVNAVAGVSGRLAVGGAAAGASGGAFEPTLDNAFAESGPDCAGGIICVSSFNLRGSERGTQGVFSFESLDVTISSQGPPPGAAPGTQATAIVVSFLVSTGAASTLYFLECSPSAASCRDPAASGVVVDRIQRTVTFADVRLPLSTDPTAVTTLNGVLRY